MGTMINSITFGSDVYPLSLPYGVCETAGTTEEKVVTVDNFSLEAGAMVVVKFENLNDTMFPTLNVNNTGAKYIYSHNSTTLKLEDFWKNNTTVQFIYDGDHYEIMNAKATNAAIKIKAGTKLTDGGTFYTNQSQAETITLNHATTTRTDGTPTALTPQHSDKITIVSGVNSDETGHITGVDTKIVTMPKASLYYVEGSGSTTDSTAKVSTWLGSCEDITNYYAGLTVAYKLDVAGSTTTTLNINGLGAVPVVRNANTGISTAYPVGSVAFLTYTVDGTTAYWKAGDYDSNTTYTNVKLGHGYATCDTAAAITAKTATLSSYTLAVGGIVNVRFANGNTASKPTLNINGQGAKSIYYNNAALTDTNLIKAGDVVTFIYSSYYRIIAINGKYFDAQTAFGPTANATPGYGGTFTVPSYTVTADGRVVAGADRTITMPSAQDLNNYKIKQPVVSDPTASGNATAFIDSISQDANGNITVTKKNVQFPNYDSTYKKIQTAVSSPTASGNTTAFIDTISQDAQGKITVTKKNVQFPDYSNTYQPKGNYKTVQTAVSDPTASGSASAFIDSISQDANGKITVTKKNLSLPSILKFIGTTTTALTDGATTNPITISGKSVTVVSGNVVILSGTDQEFLWTGSAWEEFGNGSGHSIKGHIHTVTHKPAGTVDKTSITPAGTVSQPTFSGSAVNSGENTGTNFSAAPGGHKHSVTAAGTVSQPTFTGTEATITISHTPAGTVSQPTFTGTAVTSGKPDTTNVTTIYSITGVGSLPSASLSAGTAPSHTYTAPSLTASIANKCMTFSWSAGSHSFSAGTYPTLTFSAGSLPTRSSAISMPNTNHTHSVTAAGTVSQPTFTGSSVSGSTKYTPAGTVSQPTFTGSAVNSGANTGTNTSVAPAKHKHSVTAAGTVSQPTFTGTAAEHSHTFTGTSATITTSGSSN